MKLIPTILKQTFACIGLVATIASCSSTNHSRYWMIANKNNIADKNIYDIKIPGSFHADAYNITGKESICKGEFNPNSNPKYSKLLNDIILNRDTEPKIFESFLDYTNHQKHSVYNQLLNGIRYLDFSICYQDNNFYTSTNFLTNNIDNIIEQINKFANKNPYEIIIINLDNVWDENGIMDKQYADLLVAKLKTAFNTRIINNQETNLTFRNLWNKNENILIFSNQVNLYSSDIIWPEEKIVGFKSEPELATIKKLTHIQLGIEHLQQDKIDKLNIFPIYSNFDFNVNSAEEILHLRFNSNLIIDYLYSLPQNNPLNIIVGDKYFEHNLTQYTMNQFKIESQSFRKPKLNTQQ